MKLGIYGAGSLGREILSLIKIEGKEGLWDDIVFIDDVYVGEMAYGLRNVTYNIFKSIYSKVDVRVIVATGEPKYRSYLLNKLKSDGYKMETYISDNAFVGKNAIINYGTVIFPNVYIGNDVVIHNNCIVHANAKIEADCIIGGNTFVSLGAFVGASTVLGNRVFVGPNASLFDHISIGDDSMIGMGSVVLESVRENKVLVGNPAKCIKDNISGRVFKPENCCVGKNKGQMKK